MEHVIYIWLFSLLLMRASFGNCWILSFIGFDSSKNVPNGFRSVKTVKTGFADPLIRRVSWHAITTDLTTESVVKHGEKDSVTSHHEEAEGEHPPPRPTPPPPPLDSWRAPFLLWYSFILSPCLSLSPLLHTSHLHPPLPSLPPCLLSAFYLWCFLFVSRLT